MTEEQCFKAVEFLNSRWKNSVYVQNYYKSFCIIYIRYSNFISRPYHLEDLRNDFT